MLRIPHIRKHTPQSSRQTRRSVHKRVHVFHANVTHTTTIPANQARRSQTRQPPPKRHTFKAPTAPHRHNVQPGTTAAYRHKSITFPPATVKHSKKSPRGVQRGRGFAAPLRFSFFPQKKYCASFAKKANATQYLKKSISNLLFLYLTTRTLYIPSISLSSSNALADAALSRSIRV